MSWMFFLRLPGISGLAAVARRFWKRFVVRELAPQAALQVDGVYHVGHRWGLRLVCISDTHNKHRTLSVPDGDVLIHAGDFTLYGREDHARDFDAWLADLPHKVKLVVVGNHENNAPWHKRIQEMLPHATVLRETSITLPDGPRIFGTDFYWPCNGQNPYFDLIPEVDVLIAHGPAYGCVDGDAKKPQGCKALLSTVRRVRPQVLVSGHVHFGHGVVTLQHDDSASTLMVNAANCGSGKDERCLVHPAVVVDI
eukprot:CAMPEP_0194513232 /NCGR_PEP_ID=MMETSP0253-20130528/45442_1 /TAXON_ID=2966 /ORGANISM="Noctiluca scintillans" /LENGTH=252 /DNA_ID=CAMNT_0039356769 /DNA_START=10 /DNA_END=768 /DNA_ORIENTATION=-